MIPASLRIAIVDDDHSVRKSLARLLRFSGVELHAFVSGVEFLAWLEAGRLDLAIVDVCMPVLSGFDVLARCRTEAPELPVILLSGLDDGEIAQRAGDAGARAFLHKPFIYAELVHAIHSVVMRPVSTLP